jgi:hypothetical protein
MHRRIPASAVALTLLLLGRAPAQAEEPTRIKEQFAAGQQCHVSCRVELSGTLTPEPEKGKAPKPLSLTGKSAIEYDERILAVNSSGVVQKTARIYRRIDFQRRVGDRDQHQTIRPAVRRLVLLRKDNTEVPFSPDGPLTWGEIDLVRTDVFTPALAGLLPARAARTGDRWTASTIAVKELTDMERVEEGQLDCKLEEIAGSSATGSSRRQARIAFSGTVRGINEDGPNRQQLDGYLCFDLESQHLSYLTLKGVHVLTEKDGKEVGKVEGRFTLTCQTQQRVNDLSDEALKGWTLEPNADNTLLLYDNRDLGLRFLHPRRWRIGAERGPQVTLDAADGSGLVLTIESAANVPTAAQFQKESRDWLTKQKLKVLREEPARSIRTDNGQIERFTLDIEGAAQKVLMDYFVIRQTAGGCTIAARLLPNDLATLRAEVERIARSVVISKQK